jgi:hypothetical protein
MDRTGIIWELRTRLFESEQGKLAGACERGGEPSDFIKCWVFSTDWEPTSFSRRNFLLVVSWLVTPRELSLKRLHKQPIEFFYYLELFAIFCSENSLDYVVCGWGISSWKGLHYSALMCAKLWFSPCLQKDLNSRSFCRYKIYVLINYKTACEAVLIESLLVALLSKKYRVLYETGRFTEFFYVVTQRKLVRTNFSGLPVGPIIKGQVMKKLNSK